MSTCNIKFDGEDCEVDYHFDAEDLVIDTVDIQELLHKFKNLSEKEQVEIEAKVLKYIEDQKISSKEADWMICSEE